MLDYSAFPTLASIDFAAYLLISDFAVTDSLFHLVFFYIFLLIYIMCIIILFQCTYNVYLCNIIQTTIVNYNKNSRVPIFFLCRMYE